MSSFITFADTVMEPSPRLNLILGPNGTGKSTIMNAVCVVLGGKLQLLGRSQDLGSYVRHGAEEATVEAWLYDPESRAGVARVCRRFRKDGGTSTYAIDGKKATLSDVEKLKRRFDVQLDNLSQFMPQEKIAEFVALDSKSLLQSTVRALGGTDKLDHYTDLLERDAGFETDEEALARKEQTLQDYVAKSKSLETEVQAFHAHKALKDEIKKLEAVKPWIEHDEKQEEFNACKEDTKKMKDVVEERMAEVNALRGPLQGLKARAEATWVAYDVDQKEGLKVKSRKANELVDALAYVNETIFELHAELDNGAKRLEKHAQKIDELEAGLEEDKRRLEAACRAGNEAEDQRVISHANAKRQALSAEVNEARLRQSQAAAEKQDVQRRIHNLKMQRNGLGDARSQRLKMLEQSHGRNRGISQVVEWVQVNPQAFRRKVHGPVAVEIDAEHMLAARILHVTLGNFTPGVFVCECNEDADTLRREAMRLFKFKAATMTAPCGSSGEWDPNDVAPAAHVSPQMRALGIEAVLSDLFKAPDAVKETLKAQHGLHKIFVGNENADRNMDDIVQTGLSTWFSPSSVYRCVTSRYNRSARSTAVQELGQSAGLFAGRIDEVERERAIIEQSLASEDAKLQEVTAAIMACNNELTGFQEQFRVFNKESSDAKGRITARKGLEDKVRKRRARIEALKSDSFIKDANAKNKEILEKIHVEHAKILPTTQELVTAMGACVRAQAKTDEAMAAYSTVARELREEEAKNADSGLELQKLKDEYTKMREKLSHRRRELKDARARAERSIRSEDIENDPFYAQLEFDMVAVEQLIEDKRKAQSRMTTGGSQVVENYAKLLQRVEALQKEVAAIREGQESERREFEASKTEFMDWLKERISKMARRFSDLYKGFGCRGDIELINQNSERMSALAINILVSYRDGVDLMPISGQGNSGGEKMACTMLYCFSLQEQEKSPPFVIIDELNQGLDYENELYIMKIMLNDAEQGSAPQSFVITPKLLLNLPFGENTACHIIMNGNVKGGKAVAVNEPGRV